MLYEEHNKISSILVWSISYAHGRCGSKTYVVGAQNDNLELECGPLIAYGQQQNYHRNVFPASVLSHSFSLLFQ
jgi:hypothetical protein